MVGRLVFDNAFPLGGVVRTLCVPSKGLVKGKIGFVELCGGWGEEWRKVCRETGGVRPQSFRIKRREYLSCVLTLISWRRNSAEVCAIGKLGGGEKVVFIFYSKMPSELRDGKRVDTEGFRRRGAHLFGHFVASNEVVSAH